MQLHLDETLHFLRELGANNNLAWFHAHRAEYENARAQFELLVEEVILRFNRYEDLGGIQPKDCMFRINRDVRFGRDKTPYKTNMGAVIARGGRKSPRASYYMHLQPAASFLACGVYMPEPEQLYKIRRAIADDHKSLRRILKRASFKRTVGALNEEDMLKTAPKGFPSDHPALDLLRHKHFVAGPRLGDSEVTAPDFPAHVVQVFRAMKPFNDWFNQALGV